MIIIGKQVYQPEDSSRPQSLAGILLASFPRRVFALLIDFIVAGVGFVVLALVFIFITQWTGLVYLDPDLQIDFRFFGNWYSIIWLVFYFTFSVYLSNGRTIGKKIFRIRIMSLVHHRVSLWHAFERAIGYGASTLEFGFGFIQYFIRSDRRTIHDRIAETIVVFESSKSENMKGR
jgi:uncharacterized RDD family membrane protein YckC